MKTTDVFFKFHYLFYNFVQVGTFYNKLNIIILDITS